eukprot:m.384295 g.384295  ORF g.384295 m.384295 type:complete len:52 (-) comp131735_c0_seq1:11-166(-)
MPRTSYKQHDGRTVGLFFKRATRKTSMVLLFQVDVQTHTFLSLLNGRTCHS